MINSFYLCAYICILINVFLSYLTSIPLMLSIPFNTIFFLLISYTRILFVLFNLVLLFFYTVFSRWLCSYDSHCNGPSISLYNFCYAFVQNSKISNFLNLSNGNKSQICTEGNTDTLNMDTFLILKLKSSLYYLNAASHCNNNSCYLKAVNKALREQRINGPFLYNINIMTQL